MLEILAPLLIGGVVGWILFYFIRRYKKFTPLVLVATLAAIIGGDGISSLALIGERFGNRDFHLWYFIGVAVGFIIYELLLVIIFYNKGKIKDEEKFNRFMDKNPDEPAQPPASEK